MMLFLRTSVFVCFLFFSQLLFAQPANDACANAISLTSSTSCVNTAGNMANSTASSGVTSTCTGTVRYDVWYKFVAQSADPTITISSAGSNFDNPKVELFSGTCGSLTSRGCAANTLTASGLTVGITYYVRVLSTNNPIPSSNATFNICIVDPAPPSNDECAGATVLSIGTTNSTGTVWYATASSGITAGCATGTPDDDVWYRFTATNNDATITLTSLGTNLSTSGSRLQLFSGSCGALTSLACGTTTITTGSLTPGEVYYIRVYSAGTGSIGGSSSGATFSITVTTLPSTTASPGRMNEVFQQTTLSAANVLYDPWEVAYGPDGYLWVNEARGYKVHRVDPNTGVKTTVLNISQGASGYLTSAQHTSYNVQFSSSFSPWPQGGFAGLVLHPNFMHATSPKNYVYVSYVHKYDSASATTGGGYFFTNRIVRFTYNTATGFLGEPVSVCDTLRGSNDHNSQRLVIAPVDGTYFLFYAAGDMGAGQFDNLKRAIHSQDKEYYEGKILRFNLEEDGDGGSYDQWIPNDNPFNGTKQSAVWSTGMRNNQGFAYATINGTGYLYGSSHGAYSDDEINIIEKGKNYGHPLIIGYADGNYNNCKAGTSTGTLPLITSETSNASALGTDYKDPIFSFYAAPQATIYNIYTTNPSYMTWPSEAPSGLEAYTNTIIPGWKNSLLSGMLKGGKVMRLKLNSSGSNITSTGGSDTAAYFRSVNRFRDVAIAPDGKSIFAVIDRSSTTSGPTEGSSAVSACAGCLLKFTFLGYNDVSGKSSIPSSIDITTDANNTLLNGTTININSTNNNLWVPITGPDGNILAEIKANGNNLGTVTSTFYLHSGTMREDASKRLYMNRSVTITPQNQPSSGNVSIRLYLTSSELAQIMSATNSQGMPSGVSSISNIKILKNNDANSMALTSATSVLTTTSYSHAGTSLGGYVLQTDISSFSSFYFGNPSMSVLPLNLISIKATSQDDAAQVKWETAHELNSDKFIVERSIDGRNFEAIGEIKAKGGTNNTNNYLFVDQEASKQAALVYYRLKMMDNDGAYQYSKVVTAGFNNVDINLYPNPIKNTLNIQLNVRNSDEVRILISDMQGRVVYAQNKIVKAGANEIQINTSAMPAQSYTVQIRDRNNKVLVSKNIVKR